MTKYAFLLVTFLATAIWLVSSFSNHVFVLDADLLLLLGIGLMIAATLAAARQFARRLTR
jgi:thiol:disulfide interchange protein